MRVCNPMWRAGIDLQNSIFDELRRMKRRSTDWNDLVVVAVNDQCWHIYLLQIFSEIRLRERFDAFIGVLSSGLHTLKPERVDHTLRDLRAGSVGTEKRAAGNIFVEL